MLNPESNPKRKSLEVIASPQNENLGISIDPHAFSLPALKKIVELQMFNAQPREIIIGGDEYSTPITISWSTLQKTRADKQIIERFLSDAAKTMKCSSEVLIRISPEGKSNPQEKDKPSNYKPCIEKGVILNEITVRRPSSDLVERIFNSQEKRPNRVILAEWQNERGEIVVTATINPNRARAVKEIYHSAIILQKLVYTYRSFQNHA